MNIQNNVTTLQNQILFKANQYKAVPLIQYCADSVSKTLTDSSVSKSKKFYIKRIKWPITKLMLQTYIEKNKFNFKIILNNQGERAGIMNYFFPEPSRLHVNFIKIDKKSPRNFLDTAICITQEILSAGKKNSVKRMSCNPINDYLGRLYNKRFGFSEKENDLNDAKMCVNFKKFEEMALNFIEKYS